jgi:hypothetical protein
MAKVDRAKALALGDLFSRGGGSDAEQVAHEGYPAVCDRAVTEGLELGGCSVPLKVELRSLRARDPAGAAGNAVAAPDAGAPCSGAECGEASQTDGGKPVFDQSAVERVTRVHQANVRRTCWEATSDSLKRLTLVVTIRVDVQGHVTQADPHVSDSDGPVDVASFVGRCVANDVRTWVFPEPDSEKVLTLPFHLIRQ